MNDLSDEMYESGDITVNIFDRLEGFGEDDLCKILQWLDKREQSWSFTERMASYFLTEMIKFLGEDDEYKDEAEVIAGLKKLKGEQQ